MSEEPTIHQEFPSVNTGDSTDRVGNRVSPFEHPEVQAEIDRLQEGENISETAEDEVIEWVSPNGEVRKPNPEALTIVATPEVQEVVNAHFEKLSSTLESIDKTLSDLEKKAAAPEEDKKRLFDPLSEGFLSKIKQQVANQMDQVRTVRQVEKTVEVEAKGFLGRKKKVPKTVVEAAVDLHKGHTLPVGRQYLRDLAYYEHKDTTPRGGSTITADEHLESQDRDVKRTAEELLVGTEDTHWSRQAREEARAAGKDVYSRRLPLLAARLAGKRYEPQKI